MIVGFTTTFVLMQSVSITTKAVSSNPTHCEVCLIQYCVIKFVSDLRQVGGLSPNTPASFTKADRHDITEILLEMALNTITLNPNPMHYQMGRRDGMAVGLITACAISVYHH